MTTADFERFKIDTLLRFRANHRADKRPADTLESDTDLLAARIDATRQSPDDWLRNFDAFNR